MNKLNILLIAPFKQSCGWGYCSRAIAKSLNTTECNLSIRNIYFTTNKFVLPPDLIKLEETKFNHYDIVIQKILPNLLYYDGRFSQNIAMPVFESELSKNHIWINHLNLMDKIFIPSTTELKWLSKKTKPKISIISEPIDISQYDKVYTPAHPFLTDSNFKFYTISEYSTRKNIDGLVQAYLSEFSINDNVVLVIKTNQNINARVEQIKKSIRRFTFAVRYPPILIINNFLSEEQLNSIHQYSDCFITSSRGEATLRGAKDAIGFGNPVITPTNIGVADYVSDDTGWIVPSYKDMCYAEDPPVSELYTSEEYWYNTNLLDIRKAMREAYQNKELFKFKKDNIKKSGIINNFSYETIGNNILKAINE